MTPDRYDLEKVNNAIERLTDISGDLNKLLAVADQRLGQQEKIVHEIYLSIEKRREDLDAKLKDVYNTIKIEDKNVIVEINNLNDRFTELYNKLSVKIEKIEKILWTYIGGFTVLTFIFSHFDTVVPVISKLFGK